MTIFFTTHVSDTGFNPDIIEFDFELTVNSFFESFRV